MKQPNWKTALILSGTVFVLGSFTYWLQFSHKPKKERADTELKKPLAFPAETSQIASFRLKSSRGLIEAKCDTLAVKTCKVGSTGDWTITYPVKLKGDSDAIRDLMNTASTLLAAETIDLSDETDQRRAGLMEEYGLSDSKRTAPGAQFIELTLEDGKKVAAWFGEPHPVGDKTFVASSINGAVNSRTVFLIANFYKSNFFEKTLNQLRDKSIFNFDRMQVDGMTVSGTRSKLSLKMTEGLWAINGKEADYDRVETLLSSVSQAKAKDFPEVQVMKGAKTTMKASLHFKDGHTLDFEILLQEKKSFLKSASLEAPVEVEPALVERLLKGENEFRRNLLITQAQKATLTRMLLEGKSFQPPAEFNWEGKAWIQKSQGPKLDVSKAALLIDALTVGHSPEIVSPAPKAPEDAVTLTLGDSKEPARFRFRFYSMKEKSYARDLASKADEAFLLDPGVKNHFPFKPDSWKAK